MIEESKTVTAAKAHRCDGCYGSIAKGDKHQRYTTSDDATITTSRWCGLCTSLGADLFNIGIRGEDEWGRETYPDLAGLNPYDLDAGTLRERFEAWQAMYSANLKAAVKRHLAAVQ